MIGSVITRIQEDRAEHRFEHVGEQRFQVASATFRDAPSEVQIRTHVELFGEESEGVGVDHRGARLGQLTLGRARVVLVEVFGADELQDGITEVFQALVVAR